MYVGLRISTNTPRREMKSSNIVVVFCGCGNVVVVCVQENNNYIAEGGERICKTF